MHRSMDYQGYPPQGRAWMPPQMGNYSTHIQPSQPYPTAGNSLPRFETTFSDGRPEERFYNNSQQSDMIDVDPQDLYQYFYPDDRVCDGNGDIDRDFEDMAFDLSALPEFAVGPTAPVPQLPLETHNHQYLHGGFRASMNITDQRNIPMGMEQAQSPSGYDSASLVSMSPPAPSPCYINWSNDLGSDGMSSTAGTPPPSPPIQKIKKPRRTNKRKKGHLWEFVLNLLKNPETNPSIVKWENKELGIFRFVKSKEAARLWGIKKENKEMTYEKMSRAMRYTREVGVFAHLPEAYLMKRLCYRFGDRAEGWVEVAQSTNSNQQ